jgi:hypothetical protein
LEVEVMSGRNMGFGSGLILGAALSLLMQVPAPWVSAGQARLATQNGDVNGDDKLDITDAISILSYLFLGTEAPVDIDCGTPPAPPAKFRFLNDLTCNGQGTLVSYEVCGVPATSMATGTPPSECAEVQASAQCAVRVTGQAPCGAISVCGDIAIAEGTVTDFVLTGTGQGVVALVFVRPLLSDGSCPAFPTPGDTPLRTLSSPCASGAEAGAGAVAAAWGPGGGW